MKKDALHLHPNIENILDQNIEVKVPIETLEEAMQLPPSFRIADAFFEGDQIVFDLLCTDEACPDQASIEDVELLEDVGYACREMTGMFRDDDADELKDEDVLYDNILNELRLLKADHPELSEKLDEITETIEEFNQANLATMEEGLDDVYGRLQETYDQITKLENEIVHLKDKIREGA